MTTDPLFTRRRMLQLTGGTTVAGLAGCMSPGASNEQADSTATEDSDHDEDDHDEDSDHDENHDENGDHDEGDHDEDEQNEMSGEPTETAEVAMATTSDGNQFEPHVVRVTVGGTVTWVNEAGSHSTTAYHPENDQPQLAPDGATAWDSGLLSAEGETFEHTFETEGVYHYYCTPHESTGMISSVIVGEPDPHQQPALKEPPEEKSAIIREQIKERNEQCNEALGHMH